MRAVRGSVPAWIDPVLAKPDGGRLREGPQWAYEYKLDGYRVAMRIAADGTTVLTSRNGLNLTAEFGELAGVLTAALRGCAAVLDGEVVVYNEAGQIDFGLLQQRRGRFQKHHTARRDDTFTDVPVRFLAFDLLQLGERLLLNEPYEQRRRQLTELPMPDPFRVAVVPSFTAAEFAAERLIPQRLLERVAAEGHEGSSPSASTPRTFRAGDPTSGANTRLSRPAKSSCADGALARAASPAPSVDSCSRARSGDR